MTEYKKLFSITASGELPSRDKIEEKYKWNLKDIYPSDEDWENDFKYVENNLGEYKKFEGKLGNSAGELLRCFKFDDEIGIKLERLYLYSMLSKDSDMRVTKYQAADDRIKSLYTKVSTVSSFIRPELLSIPEEKLYAMIEEEPELKVYKHLIDNLLRTKAHTLSREQEEILSLASEIT